MAIRGGGSGLTEVSARADASGDLGKADIGALVAWKRLQANTTWMAKLMSMRDSDVRALTGQAHHAALDQPTT